MVRVLRTAAGSVVAPSVLEAIQEELEVELIVCDIAELSAGFYFADHWEIVPRVDAPEYIDRMVAICRQRQVDIFWPDLDEELTLVAANRQRFEDAGVTVLLSDFKSLQICTDKYLTFQALREIGISVPDSYLQTEEALQKLDFPMLLKPRKGRGSVGVTIVADETELRAAFEEIDAPIIQEYLPGKELTIDALSDMEGTFHYCSIRERIATDSGISTKGQTLSDPDLENMVSRSCDHLQLKGPSCFQCKQDKDGQYKFIEINPRIAGTAILSQKAGAPVITDSVRVAQGKPPLGKKDFKVGYKMIRYWTAVYTHE